MKKIFTAGLLLIALLLFPALSFAAAAPGTVATTFTSLSTESVMVKFVCIGSVDDGAIPNTALSATTLRGWYLYTVTAYPTSGGTAPDAADVFILDANNEDLLGSVDGGTTAKNGLNLIHATLKKTTFPYSTYLQQAYFPMVTGGLTLKVLNQATHSAAYTIEFVFVR